MIKYSEIEVCHPLLQQHVHYFSTIQSEKGAAYFCVPNGLAGISFVISGGVTIGEGPLKRIQPRYYGFGMVSSPTQVTLQPNSQIVTAVFKPGGIRHVVKCPVIEVLNKTVDVSDILKPESRFLLPQLDETHTLSAAIPIIEQLLFLLCQVTIFS